MKLLNAILAKVEGQSCGCMYMKTIINGKPIKAMKDMRADTVYMAKELVDDVDLPYTRGRGLANEVNAQCLHLRCFLKHPHPN